MKTVWFRDKLTSTYVLLVVSQVVRLSGSAATVCLEVSGEMICSGLRTRGLPLSLRSTFWIVSKSWT